MMLASYSLGHIALASQHIHDDRTGRLSASQDASRGLQDIHMIEIQEELVLSRQ